MSDLLTGPPPSADADRLRTSIGEVISELSGDRRLVHVEHVRERPGRVVDLRTPLPDRLAPQVPHRRLWAHQTEAIDLVRSGRSVAVATGTSSGKSLCYQVPAAEAALDGGTSLFVFPTKALAQDQLLSLTSWEVPGLVAATYDGDCTPEERTWVRANANVLLTNPEMLHQGILPNHARWAPFLHRLRVVAIDELHVLRGVFGTHTAQVLRRLLRLARHYGADPTFVFTSATIGDPAGLASDLCGLPVAAVDADAAPTGERWITLWNPDRHTEGDRSPKGSTNREAAAIAARLVEHGLRTLVFCRSRRGTELVADEIRRLVGPAAADGVRAYRAGYLVEERREIEAELFSGRLHAVVATNALELGVDIGGLDAVVLCGYPGTVASFRQQIGRGGRSGRPSLAVLVAGQDQLDQWIVKHPSELFSRSPEPAVVNLNNPYVYVPHLGCAAHELPLCHDDANLWPDQLDDGVRRLVLEDRATVRRRSGRRVAVWSGRGCPAPTIGLRSASREEVRITDVDGSTIGTVDGARANEVVHPGAVYLHQGRAWRVLELDRKEGVAVVGPHDEDTYTLTRTQTSISLLDRDRSRSVGRARLSLGWVEVTGQVIGYQVRSTNSHEVLDRCDLELPPSNLCTRAVWYSFCDDLLSDSSVDHRELAGALHAAEHAAIGILPLFTICDRWDVGGVSSPFLHETGTATIVIHDAYPGGSGIAELAYAAAGTHLSSTLEVLRGCGCSDGCPACVQSPKCGNGNEPLDKAAAARLLDATLS